MKVLLVNKFFYNRGGAEVVTMTLRDELTARGFDVGVFTMSYRSNLQVPNLFVAPEVTFKHSGMGAKLAFARRCMGGAGVRRAFVEALDTFAPDVVHLHNIHSYISPVVARLAHERGCRVVWTLHDYKLLCPAYSCLNRGKVCERCFTSKRHVLAERCFKSSLAASGVAFLEALKWHRAALERVVDAFVCPSRFMREKMLQGGFDPERLHVISNFLDPVKLHALAAYCRDAQCRDALQCVSPNVGTQHVASVDCRDRARCVRHRDAVVTEPEAHNVCNPQSQLGAADASNDRSRRMRTTSGQLAALGSEGVGDCLPRTASPSVPCTGLSVSGEPPARTAEISEKADATCCVPTGHRGAVQMCETHCGAKRHCVCCVPTGHRGFLFYAGRMSGEKGVGTLLEAVAHTPYRLRLAGKGPLFDTYRGRYGNLPNIEFLGQLNAGEVVREMTAARAVVVPSECYENNPLSIIEAQCAGTPVLGAAIGGIPEMIDPDGGATFEPFDAESLARGIERVMTTEYDREAIARRARDRYSSDRHCNELFRLYGA